MAATRFAIVGLDMVEPEQLAAYRQAIREKRLDRHCKDHTFLVLGLAPQAALSDPTTWGADAVIVDPWAGFVAPAEEGLQKLCRFFVLSSQAHLFLNSWLDDLDVSFEANRSPYDWENQKASPMGFLHAAITARASNTTDNRGKRLLVPSTGWQKPAD